MRRRETNRVLALFLREFSREKQVTLTKLIYDLLLQRYDKVVLSAVYSYNFVDGRLTGVPSSELERVKNSIKKATGAQEVDADRLLAKACGLSSLQEILTSIFDDGDAYLFKTELIANKGVITINPFGLLSVYGELILDKDSLADLVVQAGMYVQ